MWEVAWALWMSHAFPHQCHHVSIYLAYSIQCGRCLWVVNQSNLSQERISSRSTTSSSTSSFQHENTSQYCAPVTHSIILSRVPTPLYAFLQTWSFNCMASDHLLAEILPEIVLEPGSRIAAFRIVIKGLNPTFSCTGLDRRFPISSFHRILNAYFELPKLRSYL